jgi:hypothetical protein
MMRTPMALKRSGESSGATADTTSRTRARTHGGEIDAEANGLNAKTGAAPHRIGALSRSDQRLRRQRAAIEGLAAHAALFDEHDAHAESGRGGRRHQSARPGADHANVGLKLLRGFLRDILRHRACRKSRRGHTYSIGLVL